MRLGPVLAAVLTSTVVGAGARAGNMTVEQSGQHFSETSVAVTPGDAIVFTNHDDVTHNISVTGSDDDATDLGLQKPGQSLSYKFDRAGRFKIRCSIHPGMKMTVSVK